MEQLRLGDGKRLLTDSVGLDEESAAALVQYIGDATNTSRQRSLELVDELCARRESIVTQSDLALAVVDMDERAKVALDTGASNMSLVLGGENQSKIYAWVDENLQSSMTRVSVDHAARLNAPTIDKEQVLNRMCGQPAGAGQEGD